MKLNELFDYQKDQLREVYISNHMGRPSSIESVTDEMLDEEFGGEEFSEEDFW